MNILLIISIIGGFLIGYCLPKKEVNEEKEPKIRRSAQIIIDSLTNNYDQWGFDKFNAWYPVDKDEDESELSLWIANDESGMEVQKPFLVELIDAEKKAIHEAYKKVSEKKLQNILEEKNL